MMQHIRTAEPHDAFRIAEIIVTNYRTNFFPFFRDEAFFFKTLNVPDTAAEYLENADTLHHTYVYDDGIIKGIIRINGEEIEKLYVEPQFQGQQIGAALLRFAVQKYGASRLWVLEYNQRGAAFYERNGFRLTGERILEDDWIPLCKMERTS